MKGRESGMPEESYWNSFFDEEGVLSRLECQALEGDILEFGCGYGLFTLAAARQTTGTVYALDIEPEMVQLTASKVKQAGLRNVQISERDFLESGCGRPDHSVVYAMLFNILHIAEARELLQETYRVLEPGGRAGIIHWNYDAGTPRGPALEIRPRPEQCRNWAEETGFHFVRWEPLDCCPYHYGFLVEKPKP